jgi:hypothetical protein
VPEASVWAVLTDIKGNRFLPEMTSTDAKGKFVIPLAADFLADNRVTATIRARKAGTGWFSTDLTGEEVVVLGRTSFRPVQLSPWPVIVLFLLFFVGVLSPFLPVAEDAPRTLWYQWKYALSLSSALFLTVGMIVFISVGLSLVNSGDKDETLSLGFASLFRGRYVPAVEPEWVFSLTAAPQVARAPELRVKAATGGDAAAVTGGAPMVAALITPSGTSAAGAPTTAVDPARVRPALMTDESKRAESADVVMGFGAPLWVLFMAVLGAGLTTLSLIVREIKNRPDFTQVDKLHERLEDIARHQFYIVFAPLGAVFVYQLLVIGKSAAEPVTVAIAALGAGLSLSVLLDTAVTRAQGLFKRQ